MPYFFRRGRTIFSFTLAIMLLKNDTQTEEIREFNFSRYPAHVQNLMGYHWKPLLFAEALKHHKAIIHLDAHVHVVTGDTKIITDQLSCNLEAPNNCEQYPMTLFWNTGHSIFATTNPGVYSYFPVDIDRLKHIEMGCAGFVIIHSTSDVRRKILKWAVLCALEKECMAPEGASVTCSFGTNSCDTYASCHRFDQSVFNILLASRHNYTRTKYHFQYNIHPDQRRGRENTSCVVAF